MSRNNNKDDLDSIWVNDGDVSKDANPSKPPHPEIAMTKIGAKELLSFENPIYGNVGDSYDDIRLDRAGSDDDLREYKDGACARCLPRVSSRTIIIVATVFVAAIVIIVIGLGAYYGSKDHQPYSSPSVPRVSAEEAKASKSFTLTLRIVEGEFSHFKDTYSLKNSGDFGALQQALKYVIDRVYATSKMSDIYVTSVLQTATEGSVVVIMGLTFTDFVLVYPTKEPTLEFSSLDIKELVDSATTAGSQQDRVKLEGFVIDRSSIGVDAVNPIPWADISKTTTTSSPPSTTASSTASTTSSATNAPVPATHSSMRTSTVHFGSTTTTTTTTTTPTTTTSTTTSTTPGTPRTSRVSRGTTPGSSAIPATTRTTTKPTTTTSTTTTTTTEATPSLRTPGPVEPLPPASTSGIEQTTKSPMVTSGKPSVTSGETPVSTVKPAVSSTSMESTSSEGFTANATSVSSSASTPVSTSGIVTPPTVSSTSSTPPSESTTSSTPPSESTTSSTTSMPANTTQSDFSTRRTSNRAFTRVVPGFSTGRPRPSMNETVACPPGYYRCGDGVITLTNHRNFCINAIERCDGVTDCRGGEDEAGCGSNCTGGGFRCRTPGARDRLLGGFCTLRDRQCDGQADCSDRSDEWECECQSDDDFRCEAGYDMEKGDNCVDTERLCDTVHDCSDASDEKNCTYECPIGHFMCKTGPVRRLLSALEPFQRFCLRAHEQCDGFVDCEDESDEEGCDSVCPPGKFKCEGENATLTGRTIPCYLSVDRCDRMPDCTDASDEWNCTYTCPENKFKCDQGTISRSPYVGFCVHDYERCNGRSECYDGSDELNCPGVQCPESTYKCLNGTANDPYDDFCIPAEHVCDKVNDCDNETGGAAQDEDGCGYRCPQRGTFRCTTGLLVPQEGEQARGFCLPGNKRCDGVNDCEDESDELGCNLECGETKFECNTGISVHTENGDRCVPSRYVCDREADCTDGSDEPANCTYSCANGNLACNTGILKRWPHTGYCYFARERCDGFQDCEDNSDELRCDEVTCTPNQFSCLAGQDIFFGNGCLEHHYKCDRHPQCIDGSDEYGCEYACQPHQFLCDDGRTSAISPHEGYCVNVTYVCDQKSDCADGSDEGNCQPEANCDPSQFACANGHEVITGERCIDEKYRCDRVYDCNDYSDETSCSAKDFVCPQDMFMCANGTVTLEPELAVFDNDGGQLVTSRGYCVPLSKKCDGVNDCMDGSDESANASCVVCDSEREFRCKTGMAARRDSPCIINRYKCDRDDDCMDGSDEEGCDYPCPDGEVACLTGLLKRWPFYGYCIRMGDVCDDFEDCQDASDEANCTGSVTCNHAQFTCANGTDVADGDRCVHLSFRCDRSVDCTDGSDEMDCEYSCPEGQFACQNGTTNTDPARGYCLYDRFRCDGDGQCVDGSDEFDCQVTCAAGYFPCEQGVSTVHGSACVLQQWQCDREEDCRDGSDERNCNYTCPAGERACRSGVLSRWPFFGYCIAESDWCDGFTDCEDGSDESDCQPDGDGIPDCPPRHFRCERNATALGDWCIPMSVTCDRVADCLDGSDEMDCDYSCPGKFMCDTGMINAWPHRGFCVPSNTLCDGINNCNDTSDEANCDGKCSASQYFRCHNGTVPSSGSACLPQSDVCDGISDCSDGSDELNCTLPGGDCADHQVACENGYVWYQALNYVRCINETERCDGFVDCEDHSDELNCSSNCADSDFRCGWPQGTLGSLCISGEKVCDKTPNCNTQIDEAFCLDSDSPLSANVTVPANHFACPVRGDIEEKVTVLPFSQRCDGIVQCPDGKDEESCGVPAAGPPIPGVDEGGPPGRGGGRRGGRGRAP